MERFWHTLYFALGVVELTVAVSFMDDTTWYQKHYHMRNQITFVAVFGGWVLLHGLINPINFQLVLLFMVYFAIILPLLLLPMLIPYDDNYQPLVTRIATYVHIAASLSYCAKTYMCPQHQNAVTFETGVQLEP
jgi:hypothetical protein